MTKGPPRRRISAICMCAYTRPHDSMRKPHYCCSLLGGRIYEAAVWLHSAEAAQQPPRFSTYHIKPNNATLQFNTTHPILIFYIVLYICHLPNPHSTPISLFPSLPPIAKVYLLPMGINKFPDSKQQKPAASIIVDNSLFTRHRALFCLFKRSWTLSK